MQKQLKTIQIKCKGASTLPLDLLLEFQGNLKTLPKKNLSDLKRRIVEDGFIAPMFVCDIAGDYKVVDGERRLTALISLRQEGFDIPMIPVDFIEAKDEKEARARVLSISSQYGIMNEAELQEWLNELDDGIAETLRLIETDIEKSIDGKESDRQEEIEPELCTCPECGHQWVL